MEGLGASVVFENGISLSQKAHEALPLFEAHSKEVGGYLAVPAKFDVGLLARLEAHGAVFNTLAFSEDRLVGYLIWYLADSSLEYEGLRSASQGPWFLAPQVRGQGRGEAMLRWSLDGLKARGYHVAFPHRWDRSPQVLDEVFTRFGAKPMEHSWWLDLTKRG